MNDEKAVDDDKCNGTTVENAVFAPAEDAATGFPLRYVWIGVGRLMNHDGSPLARNCSTT